jgi:hypothetical protein
MKSKILLDMKKSVKQMFRIFKITSKLFRISKNT